MKSQINNCEDFRFLETFSSEQLITLKLIKLI